jgi:hypothetical protein
VLVRKTTITAALVPRITLIVLIRLNMAMLSMIMKILNTGIQIMATAQLNIPIPNMIILKKKRRKRRSTISL